MTLPLLENVGKALAVHKPRISKLLGVKPASILAKLNDLYNDEGKVDQQRIHQLHRNKVQTPDILLRALYPPSTSTINNFPINHLPNKKHVFNAYRKVGIPAIEPHHLNTMIKVLLNPYNVQRPVKVMNKHATISKSTAIAYMKQRKKRLYDIHIVKTLFDDLKTHHLPISRHEQNIALYHFFYKDDPHMLDVVKKSFDMLNIEFLEPHDFGWSFYKSLTLHDTPSLNNILNISIMHRDQTLFNDVRRHINEPNRDTYKILLKGYTVFDQEPQFNDVVTSLTMALDITLVNTIIKGLLHFGRYDEAWKYTEMFEPSHDVKYLHLTVADKNHHHLYLHYYDELSKIITMEPLTLIPNIATFVPFFQLQSPNIFQLIDLMHRFHIPLTTTMFIDSFSKELSPSLTHKLLGELLDAFNQHYITDQDMVHNSSRATGNLVKLSDKLMYLIQTKYYNTPEYKKFETLANYINNLRKTTHIGDFYTINKINFAKYNLLSEIYGQGPPD